MSYKIYGLVEPGGDNLSDVRYVGVTVKSLRYRLSGHSGKQAQAMHTPVKRWVMELRRRGLRPDILLICETDHSGYAHFLEAFFYYRLCIQGNDLLNCVTGNVWGFLKKGGAKKMAGRLAQEAHLKADHFDALKEYYFRNLGTWQERENYQRYL